MTVKRQKVSTYFRGDAELLEKIKKDKMIPGWSTSSKINNSLLAFYNLPESDRIELILNNSK